MSGGFTFIEVLVVFAIIGVITAFGIIVSLDSYQRYNKHAERDLIVSLLEKARSEAVNNIAASPHGVYFGDSNNYILFARDTYGADSSQDLKVPRNNGIAITFNPPPPPTQVVFTQLSGSTGLPTIIIQVPGNPDIIINTEGGINW